MDTRAFQPASYPVQLSLDSPFQGVRLRSWNETVFRRIRMLARHARVCPPLFAVATSTCQATDTATACSTLGYECPSFIHARDSRGATCNASSSQPASGRVRPEATFVPRRGYATTLGVPVTDDETHIRLRPARRRSPAPSGRSLVFLAASDVATAGCAFRSDWPSCRLTWPTAHRPGAILARSSGNHRQTSCVPMSDRQVSSRQVTRSRNRPGCGLPDQPASGPLAATDGA
jgi:hypothetical protein